MRNDQPNPYQYECPGGIYFEGGTEVRTDATIRLPPNLKFLDLEFVNGASTYSMTGCTTEDVKNLGKWLVEVANDVIRRRHQ